MLIGESLRPRNAVRHRRIAAVGPQIAGRDADVKAIGPPLSTLRPVEVQSALVRNGRPTSRDETSLRSRHSRKPGPGVPDGERHLAHERHGGVPYGDKEGAGSRRWVRNNKIH